jgi:hypothetical protein
MNKGKISFKAPDMKKASGGSALNPSLTTDETAHTEIGSIGNVHHSKEIIEAIVTNPHCHFVIKEMKVWKSQMIRLIY